MSELLIVAERLEHRLEPLLLVGTDFLVFPLRDESI